jgi:hypothetical protein
MTGTRPQCKSVNSAAPLSQDGRTIMVHIPITLRHQGGRKQ